MLFLWSYPKGNTIDLCVRDAILFKYLVIQSASVNLHISVSVLFVYFGSRQDELISMNIGYIHPTALGLNRKRHYCVRVALDCFKRDTFVHRFVHFGPLFDLISKIMWTEFFKAYNMLSNGRYVS